MHRLCRQLYYVGMLYVLKPRFWLVALNSAFLLLFLAVIQSGKVNLLFLCCAGSMITSYVQENLTQQFLHPRSRLLPGFVLPHGIFPTLIALCAVLLITAIIGQTALSSMAVFSVYFALILLFSRFPVVFIGALWLIVGIPLVFDWSISELTLELPPILSVSLILVSIGIVALQVRRLSHLFEDDPQYAHRLQQYGGAIGLASNSRQHQQAARDASAMWGATKWSDRRLDQQFRFHGYKARQVVELLQLSFGARPAIVKTIGGAVALVAIAILIMLRLPKDEDAEFSAQLWLLFTLFAALIPGAQAGAELSQQRPYMKAELMWPLTREQLIDGLFKAAAWNALVAWLIANVGMSVVFFFVPGVTVSAPMIATFLLMSASIAALMFGLGLYDVKLTSVAERIVCLSITVIVCFGAMSLWWAQRTEIGDLPFWLVAATLGAIGMALKKNARQMWLNLELA